MCLQRNLKKMLLKINIIKCHYGELSREGFCKGNLRVLLSGDLENATYMSTRDREYLHE